MRVVFRNIGFVPMLCRRGNAVLPAKAFDGHFYSFYQWEYSSDSVWDNRAAIGAVARRCKKTEGRFRRIGLLLFARLIRTLIGNRLVRNGTRRSWSRKFAQPARRPVLLNSLKGSATRRHVFGIFVLFRRPSHSIDVLVIRCSDQIGSGIWTNP